jgi:hypothetical protein
LVGLATLRAGALRSTALAGFRDDLRLALTGFDFGLVVIWLSFGDQRQHHVLALPQTPLVARGEGDR